MRYELKNRKHGTKMTAPSKASLDAIQNGKRLADNLPVWEVVKEIPDEETPLTEAELMVQEARAERKAPKKKAK